MATSTARWKDERCAFMWLGGACVLAGLLSSAFITAKSFWLDEAASVHYADPHRSLIAVATADGGNFALYYVLLHAWLQLGTSDGFVRALSAIPAVLAIPAVYLLGRRLFDVRVGLIAAFLLAANPFFIGYAQEARGYTLFVLAAVISNLLFLQMVERGRWFDVGAYAATTAIMFYIHFFGAFVIAAQLCALLFWRGGAHPARVWLGYVAIGCALAPLVLLAARHGTIQIDWIPPLSLASIGRFFVELSGGALGLIAYALSCGYALVAVSSAQSRVARRSMGLIVTWIVVPIALCMGFSLVALPLFEPRYLIFIAPSLAIMAAVGVDGLSRRALFVSILCLFAIASAAGLRAYYAAPVEDWRAAAALIVSHARPDDVVLCSPAYANVPLQHALDGLSPASVQVSSAVPSNAAQSHARYWLVLRQPTNLNPTITADLAAQAQAMTVTISRHRKLALERPFFGVDVRLYER